MTTYAKYADMYRQRLARSQDARVSFSCFLKEFAAKFSTFLLVARAFGLRYLSHPQRLVTKASELNESYNDRPAAIDDHASAWHDLIAEIYAPTIATEH